MLGPIDDKAVRRILHKLRSDAHVAEAFAQRHRRMEDEIARSYHEGEAAGLMQAVALLEQSSKAAEAAEAGAG